jgi:hypothetical protein
MIECGPPRRPVLGAPDPREDRRHTHLGQQGSLEPELNPSPLQFLNWPRSAEIWVVIAADRHGCGNVVTRWPKNPPGIGAGNAAGHQLADPRSARGEFVRRDRGSQLLLEIIGQEPEPLMGSEGAHHPEVATVECEHGVGPVLGGERYIDGVGQVQVQVGVLLLD